MAPYPSNISIEPIEEPQPVVALKFHTPSQDSPFEWDEEDREDAE